MRHVMPARGHDEELGATIRALLDAQEGRMRLMLGHCVRCAFCAESCFMFKLHGRDPRYMPAYKAHSSLGLLYRRRRRIDRALLERIKTVVWRDCVLCTRCYCPVGVDLPAMIALARACCRAAGVHPGARESWL